MHTDMRKYFSSEHLSPTDGYRERNYGWFKQRIMPKFKELGISGRLLDVGCAKGYFEPILADHFHEIDAVDFDAQRIAEAKLYNWLTQVYYSVLDVCHHPLPQNTYDWAFSSAVFQHMDLPDRLAALENVARSLKPGASLVCFDQYTIFQRSFRNGYAPLSYQFLRKSRSFNLSGVKFVCCEGQGLRVYRIILKRKM